EVPVGQDAAGHRMQNGDIDTAFTEQLLPREVRVRTRVSLMGSAGAGDVFAAGRAVPVRLRVGNSAALERFAQMGAHIVVGAEENMHAGIDHRGAGAVGQILHRGPRRRNRACRPNPAVSAGTCGQYWKSITAASGRSVTGAARPCSSQIRLWCAMGSFNAGPCRLTVEKVGGG